MMMKRTVVVMLAAAFLGGTVQVSLAAPHRRVDPPCSIDPSSAAVGATYVVSATGIPTATAINLWITDPGGNTTGSPLGSTPDGSFNLNESSGSVGTWTYAFSGPVRNHMDVYAVCSIDAS